MRAMSNVAAELALLGRENSELKATVVHLETLVEKLRYQLAQLTRRRFGVSAEALAQLGCGRSRKCPSPKLPGYRRCWCPRTSERNRCAGPCRMICHVRSSKSISRPSSKPAPAAAERAM